MRNFHIVLVGEGSLILNMLAQHLATLFLLVDSGEPSVNVVTRSIWWTSQEGMEELFENEGNDISYMIKTADLIICFGVTSENFWSPFAEAAVEFCPQAIIWAIFEESVWSIPLVEYFEKYPALTEVPNINVKAFKSGIIYQTRKIGEVFMPPEQRSHQAAEVSLDHPLVQAVDELVEDVAQELCGGDIDRLYDCLDHAAHVSRAQDRSETFFLDLIEEIREMIHTDTLLLS